MNYQSSIEEIDSVTKVLKVSIPSTRVDESFKEQVGSLSNKVKLKGFRAGKAPKNLVEKTHGPELRQEVVQRLISSSLNELIKEHQINYVGQPLLDIESDGMEGKDLTFKANFAIYPSPEVKDYSAFSLTLPKAEVTDADVQSVIDRVRNSMAEYKPVTDRKEIKAGDVVQTTVQALVDGEGNGEGTSMRLDVSSADTPEEITAALKTMSVGDTKVVDVKQITDSEKAQGKKIEYKLTAHEILEKILPEVTDEFAKRIDGEVETVAALLTKIRDLLSKDREEQTKQRADGMILKELAQRHQFKIPDIMMDMEIYNMMARNGMIDPQKIPFERFNGQAFRERMGEPAAERVRASILVDKISEVEKIVPNEEETKKWFADKKEEMGDRAYNQFMADRDMVQSAWMDYSRRKVLDFLRGKATIKYVSKEEFEKIEAAENAKSEKGSEEKKSKKAKSKE
jgi:trigger factor